MTDYEAEPLHLQVRRIADLWRAAPPGFVFTCGPREAMMLSGAPPWVTVVVEPDGYVVQPRPPENWLRKFASITAKPPGPRAKPAKVQGWAAAEDYRAAVKEAYAEIPPYADLTAALERMMFLVNDIPVDLAVDLETTGLRPNRDTVVGFSIALGDGRELRQSAYVPANPRYWQFLASLARHARRVIGWNVAFDQAFLDSAGVAVTFTEDAKIMAWLSNAAVRLDLPTTGGEEGRAPSLKEMAGAMLGARATSFPDLLRAYGASDIRGVPWKAQSYYGRTDAEWTLRLFYKLESMMAYVPNSAEQYVKEMALLPLTMQMQEGWELDVAAVIAHNKEIGDTIDTLSRHLRDFGIDEETSQADVRAVVYKDEAPTVLTAKKGLPSLSKQALANVQGPVAWALVSLSEAKKLRDAFLEPWLSSQSGSSDSRLHPTWRQFGTYSGRYAASNPNLMQVPLELRDCLIPDSPYDVIVMGDYGQLELRVMAYVSGDSAMTDIMNNPNRDFHLEVQAKLGLANKLQAKRFNFGIGYGANAPKIAEVVGCSKAEAGQLIRWHQELFPRLWEFREQWIRSCRKRGCRAVTAISRLLRLLPSLVCEDPFRRAEAERQAFNHLIQGTAADLMKTLMLEMEPTAQRFDARLLGQVHDEIVYSVPAAVSQGFAEALTKAAETTALSPVRIVFKVGVGGNWKEAKEDSEQG